MNSRNPILTRPITDRTRATMADGILRLNTLTASDQMPSTRAQSKSEPSWAPQTAETRYSRGRAVLELLATYFTEKS